LGVIASYKYNVTPYGASIPSSLKSWN